MTRGDGGSARLFLALPLPGEAKIRLSNFQSELPGEYFRKVKEENFHVTLAFLGDTPVDRIADIGECMEETGREFRTFTGILGGPGAFPHPGEPRTIWMGLAAGGPEAGALSDSLRKRLRRARFPFDGKPFKAHITVAYAHRNLAGGGIRRAGDWFVDYLKSRGIRFGSGAEKTSLDFDEILLIRSELRPGGSVFTVAHRSRLRGGNSGKG